MSEVKRATRVGERLRMELAAALTRLQDPRVVGAIVSRIEVTDDLQLAKVYVRHALVTTGDEAAARKSLLKGLEAANRRIRGDVVQAMQLRYAPTLRFYYDEAEDARSRIDELLLEVKREREGG